MSRIVTLSRCRTNLIWLETGTLPCFFYGATDGHPTTHSFLSGKKYFSEEESLAMTTHSLKAPLLHSASSHPAASSLLHSASSRSAASSLLHSAPNHPAASPLLRPRPLYSPCCPHNNNLRFLRLYSVLPPSLTLPPPPAP